MNTSSPPPQPPAVEVVQEKTASGVDTTWIFTGMAIIPIIFTLIFHAGAAYMSYQRNQSFLWATLHFFFAVFYYPYYAFTQSSAAPAAAPAAETSILPTVQSAGRKLKKMLTGKRK